MNYIVLEGIGLWITLFIITVMLIISLVSLICVVLADKKIFVLETLLRKENEKVKFLLKKNFILQLISGEFDIDEK